VIAATAIQGLNINDSLEEVNRQDILEQNQPGPPYFYDYNSSGSTTMFYFLLGGAWTPNLNSPQTYIDPRIVNWPLDENGDFIDSTCNKLKDNLIDRFIDQLLPEDSTGILFGCGKADEKIYPGHIAFKSTLDSLGLDYEFYDHDGGHFMPLGFKKRALVFIDSLLMPPVAHFGIGGPVTDKELAVLETYPNPTSGIVNCQFSTVNVQHTTIKLYNLQGREVATVVDDVLPAGEHTMRFDASLLPAGVYIIKESSVVSRQSSVGKLVKY
jgi:hypothetical protein